MAAGLRDFDAAKTQWTRYRRRLKTLVGALRSAGYDARMPQGGAVRVGAGEVGRLLARHGRSGRARHHSEPGEFYGAPECLRFSATASDDAVADAARRLSR